MNILLKLYNTSERTSSFLSRCLHPTFFVGSLSLFILLLGYLLYRPLSQFRVTDPLPQVIPFVPKKQPIGAETALSITVGMFIQDFSVFSIVTNSFTADVILWFEFDPSLITLEAIEKFSFDRATIVKMSQADMKLKGKRLFVQYSVRLQFSSPLDHILFPFNDHRLFITLKNEYVSPNELIFEAHRSSFIIDPKAHTSDWIVIDRTTQTGYFHQRLDEFDASKSVEYPAVVFEIDLAKRGFRKVFIIMLPLLLLYILSTFTFLMDVVSLSKSILSLSSGTLTAIIAYRFVIEKIVPDVGYFTLTDHVYNAFLFVIFLIFIVNIICIRHGRDNRIMRAFKVSTFLFTQLIILETFHHFLFKVIV
jgi:hypothetical protein